MPDGTRQSPAAAPAPPMTSEPDASSKPWLVETHPWLAPLAIAIVALALNLAGNASTGLWDRDEPRYAVAVREMRERGDWLTPSFNGEPRYHKPILIYWLMGLATSVTGDNPFGARLVSALAGTGTCLLVWAMGRRFLGVRGGFLASLMLAVAPLMVAESKLATIDATMTLLIVACQLSLLQLGHAPSRKWAAIFWVCLGLAILAKGPVAPIFLAIGAGLAWWWGWPAPLAWKRLYPKQGLLAVAAICLPWFVAIGVSTKGEFFRFAVHSQLVNRVTSRMEEHGGFPGYYLALSTVVFYPWAALVPASAWAAWRRRHENPTFGFLLGMLIGPWALLECLPTRLLHYILPTLPMAILLVAWMIESLVNEDVSLRRWPLGRLAISLIAGVGITCAVGLLAAAITLPDVPRVPLVLLAVVIGTGAAMGMLWFHQGKNREAITALCGAIGVFMLVLSGWLIPGVEQFRTSRVVGETLARLSAQTGVEPALLVYQEPGAIYAMGRPIPILREKELMEQRLNETGVILTAVHPWEHELFHKKFGMDFQVLETLNGFNLSKGQKHGMEFVLMKKADQPAAATSTARAAAIEEPLVK